MRSLYAERKETKSPQSPSGCSRVYSGHKSVAILSHLKKRKKQKCIVASSTAVATFGADGQPSKRGRVYTTSKALQLPSFDHFFRARFRFGSGRVRFEFGRVRSSSVRVRFEFGSSSVRVRFEFGSISVRVVSKPTRFKTFPQNATFFFFARDEGSVLTP